MNESRIDDIIKFYKSGIDYNKLKRFHDIIKIGYVQPDSEWKESRTIEMIEEHMKNNGLKLTYDHIELIIKHLNNYFKDIVFYRDKKFAVSKIF